MLTLKLVIDLVWTRTLSLAPARPARARSRGAARHGCHCSQGDRGARDCSARRSSRQSHRAGPAALRRSGIAYPPGRCRVSREANVSTSVERCGCDESGTVSFGRSRLVARQCPGEVLASVEHAPRYGTPRAPPRGGRAGACQRHLLGPGDQRRRPAEPRRLYAVPTRDFSSMEPTTAHCPAVRPRSSGVTVVDPVALVPSRWSPGPAATTTLTRRPTQTQPPHLTAASGSEVEGVDSSPVVGVPDRALVAPDVQDPVGAGEPAGRDRADAVARRVVGQLP